MAFYFLNKYNCFKICNKQKRKFKLKPTDLFSSLSWMGFLFYTLSKVESALTFLLSCRLRVGISLVTDSLGFQRRLFSCHINLSGKESAFEAGELVSISGSERSPGVGNGNPRQYSYLEKPMDMASQLNHHHQDLK